MESVVRKNIKFSVWDVGGQEQIRGLWRHYFQNCAALVFVVDSNDAARLKEAKEEVWEVLNSPELSKVILLIFANKQDLPNALSGEEVSNGLEMKKIENHPWNGLIKIFFFENFFEKKETKSKKK